MLKQESQSPSTYFSIRIIHFEFISDRPFIYKCNLFFGLRRVILLNGLIKYTDI